MNVDLQQKRISKPTGKRIAATVVTFVNLQNFIGVWSTRVGPILNDARTKIEKWRKAGRPSSQIHDVLHGIVVIFGEGKARPWGAQIEKFLNGSNGDNSTIANTALTAVDNNLTPLTETNILNLFGQLALIMGLGSKRHPATRLISDCSYASKVLRCLSDNYVVLDDLFEAELGERYYIGFRQKCEVVGKAMNPCFSAAEVEGGLYAWLQMLKSCQKKSRWKERKI
ncbi:MAG TPA: hypothetical protein VMB22_00115 [Verrucomicrobiae bacterium]|nr:hypothetical protein [Verrucomicrobiae bacterium]